MATRPVFIVSLEGNRYVTVKTIEFQWVPGMAISQKQKCIDSLHNQIKTEIGNNVLEVSSKSRTSLGVSMSAFNLGFVHPKFQEFISVESAFQGSKVFEKGGSFPELYTKNAREAKAFFKEKDLGKLIKFNFFGQIWSLNPLTLFYNWLYLKSIHKNQLLAKNAANYDLFTDIEFNPKKSINCQAYSAALYVSLVKRKIIDVVLDNHETYILAMQEQGDWIIDTVYNKFHPKKENTIFDVL